MAGKQSVHVTPLIRRALDAIIDKVNLAGIADVSEQDRHYAQTMLTRLAEFASENVVDRPDQLNRSLVQSEAWLDQKWKMLQDEYFDRLLQIANGGAEITQRDHTMLKMVVAVVVIDMMVSIRGQIVDRMIR